MPDAQQVRRIVPFTVFCLNSWLYAEADIVESNQVRIG